VETRADCTAALAFGGADAQPDNRQPARIGCAGWSIPVDAGRYFATQGTHLERYARVLNACEINSSFYRPHRQATWERWSNSVPPGFKFAVKMPRAITHDGALNCSSEILAAFLQQISLLREKLGSLLVQLPPSLEFEHGRARLFLARLREIYGGDVAWEPRHSSWFSEEADELLRKFCVARAAADPACVPAAAQPGGFAPFVYFRLHGSPRRYYSAYSEEFLSKIADQIAILARSARVWCVFDNTAAGQAIQNALRLAANLRAR
jgi:uncharacterized protein YecE (DUF72 family)